MLRRVRPRMRFKLFGQTAARRDFQLRKSPARLFSVQHPTASKGMAHDFGQRHFVPLNPEIRNWMRAAARYPRTRPFRRRFPRDPTRASCSISRDPQVSRKRLGLMIPGKSHFQPSKHLSRATRESMEPIESNKQETRPPESASIACDDGS